MVNRLNTKTIQQEYETISAMITLFCRERHQTNARELCPKCRDLLAYAKGRLDKCPYQADKPACSSCPIHCYKPGQREQIREVMRYAGPRMMRSHPIMGIRHLLKGLKDKPKA
jgi:hypothetical protein